MKKQREIKFRVWDKKNECFIKDDDYSGPIADSEWININELIKMYERTGFILMQYTGNKDKNGKEIYEGDIVKDGKWISIIEWDGFSWVDTIIGKRDSEDGRTAILDENETANFEVIGNIYENPNLLKPKSK